MAPSGDRSTLIADRRSAFPGLPVVKARGSLRRPRRGAPLCRPVSSDTQFGPDKRHLLCHSRRGLLRRREGLSAEARRSVVSAAGARMAPTRALTADPLSSDTRLCGSGEGGCAVRGAALCGPEGRPSCCEMQPHAGTPTVQMAPAARERRPLASSPGGGRHARERETCADDAGPCRRECRTALPVHDGATAHRSHPSGPRLFMTAGCAGPPDHGSFSRWRLSGLRATRPARVSSKRVARRKRSGR